MHEYRQVLSAMRLGESDRSIAKLGLVSRTKAKEIRAIAVTQNWLKPDGTLPNAAKLDSFFKKSSPSVK